MDKLLDKGAGWLAAHPLREEIARRWGDRGLVAVSMALMTARMYPTLKYALGYGKACSKVTVAYVLGHETHGHPLTSTAGCTGSITTFIDSGHAGAANLSAVFVASYTDPGEGDTPGLTGSAQVRIVPSAGPTPTPTPPAP